MLHGETFAGSFWKPERGSKVLAKEKQDAQESALDLAAKKEAKARDKKCRWPERHKCRGGLEAAHIKDASLGGPCIPENLVTLCRWLHRRGPESIHGKQLEVRPLTKAGANGILSFYRKHNSETRKGEFVWRLVAKERSIGIVEKDHR